MKSSDKQLNYFSLDPIKVCKHMEDTVDYITFIQGIFMTGPQDPDRLVVACLLALLLTSQSVQAIKVCKHMEDTVDYTHVAACQEQTVSGWSRNGL